jgi:hypothetical protein
LRPTARAMAPSFIRSSSAVTPPPIAIIVSVKIAKVRWAKSARL